MSSKGAADPAGGIGSSRDATGIDLAEFQKLRDEITSRMQLQTTIVGAQLAVLGTGLSLLTTSPEILLGLAAISSFLWLLWLDHAEQVHKIGLYVGSTLAPRLRQVRPGSLGWERFLRHLDREHPEGRRVGNYVAVLFGGSSAFLLTTYGARMLDALTGRDGRFSAASSASCSFSFSSWSQRPAIACTSGSLTRSAKGCYLRKTTLPMPLPRAASPVPSGQ
jgi:hypothetical protein